MHVYVLDNYVAQACICFSFIGINETNKKNLGNPVRRSHQGMRCPNETKWLNIQRVILLLIFCVWQRISFGCSERGTNSTDLYTHIYHMATLCYLNHQNDEKQWS